MLCNQADTLYINLDFAKYVFIEQEEKIVRILYKGKQQKEQLSKQSGSR